MVATEVIISASPFDVHPQAVLILSQRPGTARERGNVFAQGKIDAFDVGGHDFSGEIQRLQCVSQLCTRATQRLGVHIFEGVARFNLVELAVQQAGVNLPNGPAFADFCRPVAEMGGERVIILLQAIGRKHRRHTRRESCQTSCTNNWASTRVRPPQRITRTREGRAGCVQVRNFRSKPCQTLGEPRLNTFDECF